MPIINPTNEFYSLGIRKRYGTPVYFGSGYYGWTKYGNDNPKYGVYRRVVRRGNYWTKTEQIRKGTGYVKQVYFQGSQPRTPEQQANRNKFAQAVAQWQLLTLEEKSVYNRLAIGENKYGYHIFLAEWIKSH